MVGANTVVTISMKTVVGGIILFCGGLWAVLAFTIGGLRDDANALRLALDRTSDAVRIIEKEGIQRTNDVNAKLSEQIQGLRVDFVGFGSNLQGLRTEVVKFGSNLEQMSARLDQSNKSMENLSNRLEGFGSNLEQMSARLDQSNKSMENLSNRLEGFGSNLEQMSARLDQSNKSMENLSSRLEGFGGNIEQMSTRLDQSNKSMENLSNRLDKFQAALVTASSPQIDQKRTDEFVESLRKAGIDKERIVVVPFSSMPAIAPSAR